jgi:hypothetical protein
VTVPVSLAIDGRDVGSRTLTVSANSTTVAEFTGFDLPIGFSRGVVKINAQDPLSVDNEFSFVLSRREKLQILVIDSGRPRQSVYLRQAFSPAEDSRYDIKVVPVQSVSVDDITQNEIVIVNDVARLSDAIRARMDERRKAGQGQLVIRVVERLPGASGEAFPEDLRDEGSRRSVVCNHQL